MLGSEIVCCMCGDVGFRNQLFRCSRCSFRFQHSYCSNFHGEPTKADWCNWCRSEEIEYQRGVQCQTDTGSGKDTGEIFSGERNEREDGSRKGKKMISPKHVRKYKLLKDITC